MLTRRGLLKAAGAAGIVAAGSGLTLGRARAADRPFTFSSWGGGLSQTEKDAFMDPASAKFGTPITNTSPISYAKVKAMVEANAVEWDLCDVGGQFIYQARDQGLLEKMDFSIIDTSKLDKYWVTDYGIYTSTGATLIAYNTKIFPEGKGPQSWKDFWDVKNFPGPRTLYNRLYYNYEAAVLAGGLKREEVYPATEEKVKLAFAKLTEIKPNVKVWWSAGAQQPQLLATGEVAMGSAWSGRILDAQKEGQPIALTYKEAVAWGNAYIVPKGTPYKDLAMKIINYAISEEAQTRLLPLGTYGPVLASAAAKATPEQAKLYVSYPANMAEACVFNDEEVAKYVTKYEDDWKKFQLA
ncbi:MAG: ABC transporter substrate-binding protein [Alphaproteobacteria bacterium]|nr:ABC transporter substrate-binding protein [Alphaproteobacteria bacterium]